MKKTTKDYVKEYLEDYPKENITESNLLDLAKEIKTKKYLTVKVCTIMIAIAQIMKEEYGGDWESIEEGMLNKVRKKEYLNWIIDLTLDDEVYFKIDTSEIEGSKRKKDYLSYNPRVIEIAETWHDKNTITLINEIFAKTGVILRYIVRGRKDPDIPYWSKMDINTYNILKNNPELAFKIIDKIKDLLVGGIDMAYGKTIEELKNSIIKVHEFNEVKELKELYSDLWGEQDSFPLSDIELQELFLSLIYQCRYIKRNEVEEIANELKKDA